MTSATKVFLALFALLIGVLVLYYGVWQRADPAAADTSSAKVTTPSAATVSQLKQSPGESTGRLSRSGPASSRLPASGTGNSSLLTDALLHSSIADPTSPPTPADSSLDSLAAGTSRPAANTPVTIGLNTPTPAGPPPAAPETFTSPTTVIPTSTPPTAPTNAVQPRGSGSSPTTPSSSPSGETEYIVKAGDTGTSIAKAYFGDPNKWVLISKANPWADFNRLRIGQKLKLPPKDATSVKPPPGAQPVAMGDKSTYTVQAGDTLAAIARKQLGNAGLWEQIYNANKAVIGDDPAALKVGMKLKLPEKSLAKRQ